MNKSALISWASLMAAFLKAEGVEGVGQNPQYQTINKQQLDFFEYYKAHKNDIATLSEVKSFATKNYNKLKGFLEKNNFNSSNLRPFSRDTIGIAALLEINALWEHKPGITEMSHNSFEYKAICFNSDCINIYKTNVRHEPIFKIPLKNGDWVIISVDSSLNPINSINNQVIDLLNSSVANPRSQYKGIVLP